jgi:hypothetical protein
MAWRPYRLTPDHPSVLAVLTYATAGWEDKDIAAKLGLTKYQVYWRRRKGGFREERGCHQKGKKRGKYQLDWVKVERRRDRQPTRAWMEGI